MNFALQLNEEKMKLTIKIFTKALLLTGTLVMLNTGCKLDIANPNGPTDAQILTTRDGLITLSVGMRQYYSTTGLDALILTPGTTAREVKGITTFTNIIDLEAGSTSLTNDNGNILGIWLRMYHVMGMAEDILASAPTVLASAPGTLSGIMAHAQLLKAMAIGGLATSFEQVSIQTNKAGNATFVDRKAGLTEAVRLLDAAAASITATPPTADFNTLVQGADFDLKNTVNAYRARYNLMLGNYAAAITAANAVDLTKKSMFVYNTQSPNPIYQDVQISKNYAPRVNFGLPADLFETGDARETFYLTGTVTIIGTDNVKKLAGFFDAIDRPIPAYLPDEIRLIRAESLVRSGGDLAQAVVDINAVRTQKTGDPVGVNAGLPAYAGASTTDALLKEIYKQREAELFLTGLRLEDSRRFGRPAPPTSLVERTRNFYPYPAQERQTNTNIPADPAI